MSAKQSAVVFNNSLIKLAPYMDHQKFIRIHTHTHTHIQLNSVGLTCCIRMRTLTQP
jgi:hypothetical protein